MVRQLPGEQRRARRLVADLQLVQPRLPEGVKLSLDPNATVHGLLSFLPCGLHESSIANKRVSSDHLFEGFKRVKISRDVGR
jgi:hypothetical protein